MGFSGSSGGGSESSGIITAGSTEIFFGSREKVNDRNKFGQYNLLIVTNVSAENMLVTLDGLTVIGIAPANGGSLGIQEQDGIFFGTVHIKNISATDSSADEVKVFATRTEDNAIN